MVWQCVLTWLGAGIANFAGVWLYAQQRASPFRPYGCISRQPRSFVDRALHAVGRHVLYAAARHAPVLTAEKARPSSNAYVTATWLFLSMKMYCGMCTPP